jgi:hypothetical protein
MNTQGAFVFAIVSEMAHEKQSRGNGRQVECRDRRDGLRFSLGRVAPVSNHNEGAPGPSLLGTGDGSGRVAQMPGGRWL